MVGRTIYKQQINLLDLSKEEIEIIIFRRNLYMNEKDFLDWCKQEVRNYTNKHLDKTDKKEITTDDVFMVWCCKTLQNNKALLSTTLFDGMYYECTYNGDKDELYFDAYKKWENKCIKGEKEI